MTQATDQPRGWDRPSRDNPPEPNEPGNVVAKRADISLGLPVRTLDEAFRMSNALSHSGLVPSALRGKGPDILAVLLYGAELGLSVWQSIHGIHVIEGRPSMSAELRVAKTRERGHRVGVVCRQCGEYSNAVGAHRWGAEGTHRFEADWDNTRCTVMAQRADTGESATITWTIDDAIAAGKVRRMPDGSIQARSSNGGLLPWEAYTRDMLWNRASSRAAKLIAPEVGYGVYTPEETEDIIKVESTVDDIRCSHCHGFGHIAETCPQVVDADPDDDEAVRATVVGLAEDISV